MLYTTLISAALMLTTSVQSASLGGAIGGYVGRPVGPKPIHTTGPHATPPSTTPDCEVYNQEMYPYRMIALNKRWNNIYGTGDKDGYVVAYGGDEMTIQAGPNAQAARNIVLLHLEDSVSKRVEQRSFVIYKNKSCVAKDLPTVVKTRNENYWKVSVFAIGDFRH